MATIESYQWADSVFSWCHGGENSRADLGEESGAQRGKVEDCDRSEH